MLANLLSLGCNLSRYLFEFAELVLKQLFAFSAQVMVEITSSTMLLNLLILKLFDFAWGRECKSTGKNESFIGKSNIAGELNLFYLNSLNYEGETPLHLIAEIYSNGKSVLKFCFMKKVCLQKVF